MQITTMPVGQIGANCYILYTQETDGCIVIDPGDEPDVVVRKLDNMGLAPEYILITHGHPDHVGGVAGVKRAFPEAKVLIHAGDKGSLQMRAHMHHQVAAYEEVVPDGFMEEGDVIASGGITLRVIHTPGHSPGGVCLYEEEAGCLFAGDTLFRAAVGRSDFPGGNYADLEASIQQKLYILPPETVVYPGHSSATTIGDEMLHNPYIRAEGSEG